jgi:hypothetical protein
MVELMRKSTAKDGMVAASIDDSISDYFDVYGAQRADSLRLFTKNYIDTIA